MDQTWYHRTDSYFARAFKRDFQPSVTMPELKHRLAHNSTASIKRPRYFPICSPISSSSPVESLPSKRPRLCSVAVNISIPHALPHTIAEPLPSPVSSVAASVNLPVTLSPSSTPSPSSSLVANGFLENFVPAPVSEPVLVPELSRATFTECWIAELDLEPTQEEINEAIEQEYYEL
jgi:hypothetical protein